MGFVLANVPITGSSVIGVALICIDVNRHTVAEKGMKTKCSTACKAYAR